MSPDLNGHDGLAEGPEDDVPMSFFDHLTELRSRLIRVVIGVVIGFIVAFYFAGDLLDFVQMPLTKAWNEARLPGNPKLQVLEIQGRFMIDVRIAITAGIFIAAPIVFYQLWMFISPGLYKREKRFAIPFVLMSVFMFTLGGWFAFEFVLPYAMWWLLNYPYDSWLEAVLAKHGVISVTEQYQLELGSYVAGATRMLLAFGAVFEFPLLVAFLAKTGLVTHRTLLRFWKISVLLIFVVAGLLTPPEPVTQLMMALPMTGLFFVSVLVAYVINPASRQPAPTYAEIPDEDPPDEDDDGASPSPT
jgi:sec-independent protein translocase protein TatC